MENNLLSWGLRYLQMGWSVIPVKEKSKEPLVKWEEYQKRKATEPEVKNWIREYPNMNFGVVTGSLSNLVVVDVDGIEGKQSFSLLNPAPTSIIALTGKGKQYFYKWTEPIKNSVKKIAPGIDIRGDGGFVVVCPSVHPNGKSYRWQRFVPGSMTPFPKEKFVMSADGDSGLVGDAPPAVGKEPGWIAKSLEGMKIGNIDVSLTSILGRLRRDGYVESDVHRLLEPHALAAGATKGHLEEKIRNIWNRYPSENTNVNTFGTAASIASRQELTIHSPNNTDSYDRFQQFSGLQLAVRSGLCSGFPSLDKMLEGGLKSERLFTVAARTGTGKTNFAIALARALCEQGKKVLFFSTEFRYEKIWQRYIATLANPESFRGHAFYVCDSFTPAIQQVEEAIKGVMPDVFIFDHINHLGEEREGLGVFMQGCNFLQRKYNAQGIMVAQLNRQADWVENGKRIEPRMSMIKGSGTIEQASSRVLLLSEVRVTPEYNQIIGVLDKNDSGDRGTVSFGLYKNPYVLRELV